MKKEQIIKDIVRNDKTYRFTHDELMRMTKKELLRHYQQIEICPHSIRGKSFFKICHNNGSQGITGKTGVVTSKED